MILVIAQIQSYDTSKVTDFLFNLSALEVSYHIGHLLIQHTTAGVSYILHL